MIDCTGVNDVALHCAEQVLARTYLPSQADGLPFAIAMRRADDSITLTRVDRLSENQGDRFPLFFSYHLRRDPGRLLAETEAGNRPRR